MKTKYERIEAGTMVDVFRYSTGELIGRARLAHDYEENNENPQGIYDAMYLLSDGDIEMFGIGGGTVVYCFEPDTPIAL